MLLYWARVSRRSGVGAESPRASPRRAGSRLRLPRQIRGEPPTAAGDVYALGCVLYHASWPSCRCTGRNDTDTLEAQLKSAPPRISDHAPELPAELDDLLARALAKDPADRHVSPDELAAELSRSRAGGRRAPRSGPQARHHPAVGGEHRRRRSRVVPVEAGDHAGHKRDRRRSRGQPAGIRGSRCRDGDGGTPGVATGGIEGCRRGSPAGIGGSQCRGDHGGTPGVAPAPPRRRHARAPRRKSARWRGREERRARAGRPGGTGGSGRFGRAGAVRRRRRLRFRVG